MRSVINIGSKFGHLQPVAFVRDEQGKPLVRCRCDCGAMANVPAAHLNSGKRKSCGHVRDKIVKARFHPRNAPPSDERSALSVTEVHALRDSFDADLMERMAAR